MTELEPSLGESEKFPRALPRNGNRLPGLFWSAEISTGFFALMAVRPSSPVRVFLSCCVKRLAARLLRACAYTRAYMCARREESRAIPCCAVRAREARLRAPSSGYGALSSVDGG